MEFILLLFICCFAYRFLFPKYVFVVACLSGVASVAVTAILPRVGPGAVSKWVSVPSK